MCSTHSSIWRVRSPRVERGRLFTEATTRPARCRGGAGAIRERRHRHSRDRARRADVLADHGVRHQRLGGSARGNVAYGREDWRAAGNADLSAGRSLGVLLEAFAETIETGKPFPVSTADMLDVVGAFEAIIRSMAEDRPVSVLARLIAAIAAEFPRLHARRPTSCIRRP